jgi:hypothetical protein
MNSAASGRATAELRKLAHTLGVEPARLDALAGVPMEDLRTLRRQAAEALFQADRPQFVKVAALAKAIPVPVAAKITERAMPPLLAARVAELLEPQRAVEMVARLSDGYLADVSTAMDPSRSPAVIRHIPAERIARVGAELARRQEWIVIGGFVSYVDHEGLAATVRQFTGAQLLRIGFVLEDPGRLGEIIELLSERQLDQMLEAAGSEGLWVELDDLLAQLGAAGPGGLARLAERYAAAPHALHGPIAAAVERGDLHPPAGWPN